MTTDSWVGVARPAGGAAEWNAAALRPVAHWVLGDEDEFGRAALRCVWEVPDPQPPA